MSSFNRLYEKWSVTRVLGKGFASHYFKERNDVLKVYYIGNVTSNSLLKQLLLQDFLLYILFTFNLNKGSKVFFTVNNKEIASYASHHLIVYVREI